MCLLMILPSLKTTLGIITGAIGMAICGCYNATTYDLGVEAPTNEQIESILSCSPYGGILFFAPK